MFPKWTGCQVPEHDPALHWRITPPPLTPPVGIRAIREESVSDLGNGPGPRLLPVHWSLAPKAPRLPRSRRLTDRDERAFANDEDVGSRNGEFEYKRRLTRSALGVGAGRGVSPRKVGDREGGKARFARSEAGRVWNGLRNEVEIDMAVPCSGRSATPSHSDRESTGPDGP